MRQHGHLPCTTATTFGTPKRRQDAASAEPAGGSCSHVGKRFDWPITGCFFAIVYSIRQIDVSSISHSSRQTFAGRDITEISGLKYVNNFFKRPEC